MTRRILFASILGGSISPAVEPARTKPFTKRDVALVSRKLAAADIANRRIDQLALMLHPPFPYSNNAETK